MLKVSGKGHCDLIGWKVGGLVRCLAGRGLDGPGMCAQGTSACG